MSDLDFIEEIRVAQYWRKQLGEEEYVKRNPEDLHRWYVALETRGPDEIRDYLKERSGRHPPGEVTGIVFKPPHPTPEIIDVWLQSHNHVSRAPYWWGMAAFLILCLLVGPNVSGCQNLRTTNYLAMHPPAPPPVLPGSIGGPQQPLSTVPQGFPVPAHQASPPAGSQGSGSSQQH